MSQLLDAKTPPEDQAQPRKATRRSVKGEQTRAKILDAAEHLFSVRSYDAVSQRDVAERAGVLIGLVTHHYPNKISLFDAVARRRAAELNGERLKRLAAIQTPTIEAILDAFFLPMVQFASSGKEGWDAYSRLMSRFGYSPDSMEIYSRYYEDTVRSFIDMAATAAPDLDRDTVSEAFIYSIHIMLTSLYLPTFAEGFSYQRQSKKEIRSIYRTIRPFILGGFEGLVRAGRK